MFIKHDTYMIFDDYLKHDKELLCGGEKKKEKNVYKCCLFAYFISYYVFKHSYIS